MLFPKYFSTYYYLSQELFYLRTLFNLIKKQIVNFHGIFDVHDARAGGGPRLIKYEKGHARCPLR